jgi:hypothetical protein
MKCMTSMLGQTPTHLGLVENTENTTVPQVTQETLERNENLLPSDLFTPPPRRPDVERRCRDAAYTDDEDGRDDDSDVVDIDDLVESIEELSKRLLLISVKQKDIWSMCNNLTKMQQTVVKSLSTLTESQEQLH